MTIKITLQNKLEQLRKRLGIKTECEQAFEAYKKVIEKRRIIYNIYKKGIDAQDEAVQAKALRDMREFCTQKTLKCMRGKCSCEGCYFGFGGLVSESASSTSSTSSASPSSVTE